MSAGAVSGPFFRDQLLGIGEVAHLYTGAEGPALHAHAPAMQRYLTDKSDGDAGRARAEHELERCRDGLAALLGGRSESVAILGNASEAIDRLVAALDLPPGCNVVTSELEFPSGIASLLALRDRGVRVCVVPSKEAALDDFAARIDDETRLVLASHTSFATGARIDAPALRQLANDAGAAFILDATQALGVSAVAAEDADAIVSSSYKWLLGPHGIGVIHLTAPEVFSGGREAVGWRSVGNVFTLDRFERYHLREDARRLELGFPSFPSAYMLAESLDLLRSVEPNALHDYTADLTTDLLGRLAAGGAQLLTPLDPARRGTNVSVEHERGAVVAARMLDRGVRVWGGDGRVRFSVHGFATRAEIRLAAQVYQECA